MCCSICWNASRVDKIVKLAKLALAVQVTDKSNDKQSSSNENDPCLSKAMNVEPPFKKRKETEISIEEEEEIRRISDGEKLSDVAIINWAQTILKSTFPASSRWLALNPLPTKNK